MENLNIYLKTFQLFKQMFLGENSKLNFTLKKSMFENCGVTESKRAMR